MTLQIIGSGFVRTGTMSTKMALEELGFGPCHHMVEVMGIPDQPGLRPAGGGMSRVGLREHRRGSSRWCKIRIGDPHSTVQQGPVS